MSEPDPEKQPRPDATGDGARRHLESLGWDAARPRNARERRLVLVVESFLRDVRAGGSLDPEPYLEAAPELREELEPLLLAVLRLEASADRLGGGTGGSAASDGGGPAAAGGPA